MPKLQWRTSEKGNPTTEIDGLRVTVFQQDGGWKYAIKDPLSDRETYFSDLCKSEDDAKERAINNVTADTPAVPFTRRQIANRLKDRLEVLSKLAPKLTKSIKDGLTPEQIKRLHPLIDAHFAECEPLQDAVDSLDFDDPMVESIEGLIEFWDGMHEFISQAMSKLGELNGAGGVINTGLGGVGYIPSRRRDIPATRRHHHRSLRCNGP